MRRLTKFEIKGLFGNKDVSIPINSDALILVGPNGIGKSSVINIFYFFVTRQWARLLDYSFSEISLWFGQSEVHALRSDIGGLSNYRKMRSDIPPGSRFGILLDRLKDHNLLEEFAMNRRMGPSQRERYAALLEIPVDEIRSLQTALIRRFSANDDDLFSQPRIALERVLSESFPSRTIYLPTYRRIEKDLRDIFPESDELVRLQSRLRTLARSASHYVDLVSFGMEDVRSNIEAKTRSLRDYSLGKYNNLSGLYLRDVIKGNANQFAPNQIANLTDDSLSAILSRVSEQVLSTEDKNLLRFKITEIKGKRTSQLDVNDLYLAHYFTLLMSVSSDIANQETEVSAFVDVCNAYLSPGKQMIYDETKFTVTIVDEGSRSIELSMLSSGEKQVVSIFSHLYLDETRNQVVIIDEPELSLSVPWQKRFLTDILDSNHCSFILSVTHSPFIYQNKLEKCAVDLRRKTKISKSL